MKRVLPLVITCAALGLCTVPTLIAVLEYFPLWMGEGVAVPGLTAVLLCLAALPLWRLLHRRLRSPSLWMLWLFLWLLLTAVKGVIDGLCAVAMVSFLGGLAGALLFRLADYVRRS